MSTTLEQARGAPGTAAAPVVFQTHGLTKRFHGFTAVDQLDLSVSEGSIHGLIGPNGAGKSTVFNLLTGFLPPSGGSVFYRGRDITNCTAVEVARMGIVRSFQISAVFNHLSVLDNMRVGLQRQNGLATQCWRSGSALKVLDDRAMALLESVGLADHASRLAVELSYGRKRALELATTMAQEPDVMLLDEPMAGIAHEDIETISEVIGRYARGRTVVMVEHNLSVVKGLCDRITVLQRGRILAEGGYDAVSRDPRVQQAYMGSDDD